MERRVKERLIGACILVVLVVAVVPELLSGPKPVAQGAAAAADAVRLPAGAPDPVRNVTLDLATSKPALADPVPVPAAPPAAQGGASNTPSAAAPEASSDAAPAGAPAEPRAAGVVSAGAPPAGAAPANADSASALSSRAVETAPPPPASGPGFAVQLGSFAERRNAEKLLRQLKAQGFSIYMNAEGSGAASRYRVRVGPLADRDAADRMVAKLKVMGHAASIVGPR